MSQVTPPADALLLTADERVRALECANSSKALQEHYADDPENAEVYAFEVRCFLIAADPKIAEDRVIADLVRDSASFTGSDTSEVCRRILKVAK